MLNLQIHIVHIKIVKILIKIKINTKTEHQTNADNFCQHLMSKKRRRWYCITIYPVVEFTGSSSGGTPYIASQSLICKPTPNPLGAAITILSEALTSTSY